jgi:transposase-like protein
MLPRPKKNFTPEYREEAVKSVIETSRPVAEVARELGINPGTLSNWVGAFKRETRELRMENEFLKKAAAYFARDHR